MVGQASARACVGYSLSVQDVPDGDCYHSTATATIRRPMAAGQPVAAAVAAAARDSTDARALALALAHARVLRELVRTGCIPAWCTTYERAPVWVQS